MTTVASLVFAAMLIEAIVNIVKNIQERETSWKYWTSLALGLLVGTLIAYNWSIDLFTVVGMPAGKISLIGPILTGVILSRGSNVVNDLIGLINTNKLT